MELETFFTVSEQTRLLFCAILLGIPLGMCFDVLRVIRLLIRHGKLAAALEDIFFLLLWTGALICFSVVLARGELRGYYVLGSALGFLLYCCTIGNLLLPLMRRVLSAVGRALRWLMAPAFHAVVRICSNFKEKFGHFAKVSGKGSFFSHLPLIADQKVLYNRKRKNRWEAVRRWQDKRTEKKKNNQK